MKEDVRWPWLALGFVMITAAVFGFLNGGERVALHLGLFVLYQVHLVVLLFVAFLLGMSTMFLLGLRHDLKVRRLLRERRYEVPPPPPPPAPRPYPPPDTEP
jgi:hypothetical protein